MAWKVIGVKDVKQDIKVEVCDICAKEMPSNVYPRFGLTIEHRQSYCADDDTHSTYFWSLCSPQCVATATAKRFKDD